MLTTNNAPQFDESRLRQTIKADLGLSNVSDEELSEIMLNLFSPVKSEGIEISAKDYIDNEVDDYKKAYEAMHNGVFENNDEINSIINSVKDSAPPKLIEVPVDSGPLQNLEYYDVLVDDMNYTVIINADRDVYKEELQYVTNHPGFVSKRNTEELVSSMLFVTVYDLQFLFSKKTQPKPIPNDLLDQISMNLEEFANGIDSNSDFIN